MSNYQTTLQVKGTSYEIYSLKKLQEQSKINIEKLPFSLKVLLENLLRHQDGKMVTDKDIDNLANWGKTKKGGADINYFPARVLMQDFTGVPAVVDLAAMRDALKKQGHNPDLINPLTPVDLVIDHSVNVDAFGTAESFEKNVEIEFDRNGERYSFLRWGQKAFKNFRVVPPGTGICHQVNLEYLAQTVWTNKKGGKNFAYPDTLVGTDSHTTMVNALAVLGWGVGGIEAEACMLGQPYSMLVPEVIGFRLKGKLSEGVTATDLVLTVTQMLRKHGVVGKFVEFTGPGVEELTLADRATISNMAPEYGATCGFFPITKETLNYLKFTGRDEQTIALVEAYAKEQGMFLDEHSKEPEFTDILDLDLATVEASLAGPRRPQDRVALKESQAKFNQELASFKVDPKNLEKRHPVAGKNFDLATGDVVIAAITSCTNTSNPSVMVAAGLVAKKARAKGLKPKPWVKTSFAPGSQVVTEYMIESRLQEELDAIGFNLVGYGCTTCIGNSGPLAPEISKTIADHNLVAVSVLSGNRNFEGRISPDVRANYLASPPLVVMYALAGTMNIDLQKDPIGLDQNGNDVFMKDLWPSNQEIKETIQKALTPAMFTARYSDVFKGPKQWQEINTSEGVTYNWDSKSTYIKNPPYFEDFAKELPKLTDIKSARALCILGDSVTTDHISPAGNIKPKIPAGQYLSSLGVKEFDFNSFGARRGNHEVMMRGTFGNIRIKNEMCAGVEGPYTVYVPNGEQMYIYDAAMKYKQDKTDLVVFGGKEYGTGSSRDWAAKGTILLGVRAVIVESFERIHRSNLIGMGVLPLVFKGNDTRLSLKLTGKETYDLIGLEHLEAGQDVKLVINYADQSKKEVTLKCRLDTQNEVDYYRNGGILQYVMRNLMTK